MRDAAYDGRKALQILRKNYVIAGKPNIITLYTEFTSLKKARMRLSQITLSRAKKL